MVHASSLFYPMFLLSRGLDLFQINVILAIFLISTFVFEVPTGAVADVYGRKISFLLSCAIRPVASVQGMSFTLSVVRLAW